MWFSVNFMHLFNKINKYFIYNLYCNSPRIRQGHIVIFAPKGILQLIFKWYLLYFYCYYYLGFKKSDILAQKIINILQWWHQNDVFFIDFSYLWHWDQAKNMLASIFSILKLQCFKHRNASVSEYDFIFNRKHTFTLIKLSHTNVIV